MHSVLQKGGPTSQPQNTEPPSSGQSSDMPGPDRPEDAEVSRWEETVEGAQSPIRESGWSSASGQLVKVEASGMELRNLGYASSSSLYDFSRDNDVSTSGSSFFFFLVFFLLLGPLPLFLLKED